MNNEDSPFNIALWTIGIFILLLFVFLAIVVSEETIFHLDEDLNEYKEFAHLNCNELEQYLEYQSQRKISYIPYVDTVNEIMLHKGCFE